MRKLFVMFAVLALLAAGCSKQDDNADTRRRAGADTEMSADDQRAVKLGMVASSEAPMAPDFVLPKVDGGSLQLSDLRGQVVVLDFWDTWCPPCKKEIPGFIELQEQYGEQGLTIIGAAFGREGREAVKKFAEEWEMNYPVVMVDPEVIRAYGGIQSIPTTFVIDPNGKARAKHVGYVDKEIFEREIKALLPEG